MGLAAPTGGAAATGMWKKEGVGWAFSPSEGQPEGPGYWSSSWFEGRVGEGACLGVGGGGGRGGGIVNLSGY